MMTQGRTIDFRQAIAERNAHSYYAIEQMAGSAGLTMAAWAEVHQGGMTPEETKAYDAFIAQYHRVFVASLPRRKPE